MRNKGPNQKRLFPKANAARQDRADKKKSALPPLQYDKIRESRYVRSPESDGAILRYMFVDSCIMEAASLQVDSLKDDETVTMRVERVGGGEERSFEIGKGYNTVDPKMGFKVGDRIVLRCISDVDTKVEGIWVAIRCLVGLK